MCDTVTRKQKREVGLVMPVKFKCMAKKTEVCKDLAPPRNGDEEKFNYFELNVTDFEVIHSVFLFAYFT